MRSSSIFEKCRSSSIFEKCRLSSIKGDLEKFGFGLELGKDCYPYFSGWVGRWVVGEIGTKASPSILAEGLAIILLIEINTVEIGKYF